MTSLVPPNAATESASAWSEPSRGSSLAERNFTKASVRSSIAKPVLRAMSNSSERLRCASAVLPASVICCDMPFMSTVSRSTLADCITRLATQPTARSRTLRRASRRLPRIST